MVKEIISKRVMLIITFVGLVICKIVGHNGSIDDALLVIIGAIAGKEVLSNG